MKTYRFKESVWIYPGAAAWHFVTLPKDLSARMMKECATLRRGWNSIPVVATIGKVSWPTSVFFDTRSNAYMLPLKLAVRRKAGTAVGDVVSITLAPDTKR